MQRCFILTMAAMGLSAAVLLTGCGEEEADLETAVTAQVQEAVQPLIDQTRRMEKRLRVVETENGQLKSDLEALQLASAAPKSVAPTGAEVAEPASETLQAQLAETLGDKQEIASYFAQVAQRQILAHEEQKRIAAEKEREERRIREEEDRDARDAERTATMASELGLDQDKATQLLAARTVMRQSMREMFNTARDQNGQFDRDTMREAMTQIREKHDQTVAAFMSEDQLKAYGEMNDRSWWMGGGRGRGRGN